jgi:large subunit ribosomal protein L9
MKVILLRDVARIGRRNQLIEVPDGYAQNKLIPQKLAMPATPANLKRLQANESGAAAAKDAKEEAFLKAVAKLKETILSISIEANKEGHLFKAIHEVDIVAAAKQLGVSIEVGNVLITSSIKSLGEHEITLVHQSNKIPYTITIVKK